MDESKKDLIQDEEIVENTENLEDHEDSDAEKWDKVFGLIDSLTTRLDSFEKWVNETIGGIDKTESDEAEDSAYETGSESEEEVADIDKDFYERQKRYLSEGGY
jgi:hypothetical protein